MKSSIDENATVSNQIVDHDALYDRATRSLSALPRPILRWAGSKQRLLKDLVPILPVSFNTYYEPFLGSGALFFAVQPRRAVIADTCRPLIEVYRTISRSAAQIHESLKELDPFDSEMYYRVRAERPTDPVKHAANFVYLNRACWNGLYRVNSKGEFNVPYGAPKSAALPGLEHLKQCGVALRRRGVSLRVGDFARSVEAAGEGDLVFFDPPYVTGHNNNGFVDYNETLFSWADQVRLAQVAQKLQRGGAHVIITNAMHEAVIDLYSGFNVRPIVRASTLASDKAFRGPVTEALIYS